MKPGNKNSYNSLKYLFEKNGLKIFKMSENKINGGSYRIYCKKNIKKSIKYQEQAGYNEIIKFIKRVKENKKMTIDFINKNIKKGKKIFLSVSYTHLTLPTIYSV